MFNCLIVDDEMPAREELKYLLKSFEDINIIGEASHGLEAIELNNTLNPDLIFLDIQMPQINGIDVAKKIYKDNWLPLIIFTTAYDDFAIKAFETNAVDYLLKPISLDRLEKAINKSREIFNTLTPNKESEKPTIEKICLYNDGSIVPVDFEDIVYATVEEGVTIIFTSKGSYEYKNSLSNLEEKLSGSNFFRSHRSFLINLDYIEKIEPWFNSTFLIKMKNSKEEIYVSRNKVKEFKKIMDII